MALCIFFFLPKKIIDERKIYRFQVVLSENNKITCLSALSQRWLLAYSLIKKSFKKQAKRFAFLYFRNNNNILNTRNL